LKKFIILASAVAALASTPAMAAGEGRIEGRAAIGWAAGSEDFFAGVAAGYDFDLGETVFAGPEVSYDTNFDGADLVNVGGRLGVKLGEQGKLYVAGAYEINDAEEFNAAVGYQHSFTDKVYGKVEYRRYFFNGTDLNAAGVGIGVKF
jgi:outer membrane immunogenic protein